MNIQPDRQPVIRLLFFLGGVLLALGLTVAAFYLLRQPTVTELQEITLYLGTSALLSVVVAYLLVRTGLIERSPRLLWTLVAIAAVTALLVLINVWLPAQWLAVDQETLSMMGLLVLFAALIGACVMLYLAASFDTHLRALAQGMRAIARGHLATRVILPARDETADLARSFNQLALQLEQISRRQHESESMRRALVTWVGHDLRTPLASVRAMIQALADDVVEDPVVANRYLQSALHDLNDLSRLVDDLYEMALINTGGLKVERRPQSLSNLITSTLALFEPAAERKSIQIDVSVMPGVDPVMMDADRIERVLIGLLDNAICHTPDGGKITVRAYPVPEGVSVDVADNGEGIAPEDLPRIFDQFFRADKTRKHGIGGAGLGLAIARGIVEAHGGRITVQSAPNQGTTVNFRIPQTTQVEVRNPLRRWRGKSVDGGSVL